MYIRSCVTPQVGITAKFERFLARESENGCSAAFCGSAGGILLARVNGHTEFERKGFLGFVR